jgi:Major Facilitator Superfamily
MPPDNGWDPLSKPRRRVGAAAFVVTPFTRLARTHAAAVAADTLIALALANSLFFDISPDAARSKVALYLALTMAPFAVVAPLIGPALDRARGGRRFVVIGANAGRAIICLFLMRDINNLLLFPEAFLVLVLSKSYSVARSALVPTVVRSDDELVEANSRLQFLSGIVGFAAAIPGGIAFAIKGSEAVLVLAATVSAVAAVLALRIPATRVAEDHTSPTERHELRGGGILLAASAMGLLRGMVGFMTFLIAFSLRSSHAPTWNFALILAASGVGALLGSLLAPALRNGGMGEERILEIVLGITAAAGLVAAWAGGLQAAGGLALCMGMAASTGKLAFDSLVQRDAPDANRGRSFAKFETRFQLTWVVGAFLPVVIPIPRSVGFLIIALAATFALVSYLAGQRALSRGDVPARRNPTEAITNAWSRRRRQGFRADNPETAHAQPPIEAEAREEPAEPEPGPAPPEPEPEPQRDTTGPGELPPLPPPDRRVVIDPTDL